MRYVFFIALLSVYIAAQDRVQLLIFSFNRPMQLYALLESCQTYMQGCDKVTVLYRTDIEYEGGYSLVKKDFPGVLFIQQSSFQPRYDFKKLTLQALDADITYTLFAVDDIIMTRFVDIKHCGELLEKHRAYGFFLRLGKHITECNSAARVVVTGTPPLQECAPGVFSWIFKQGSGDWGYPHSVDMVLYRTRDVLAVLTAIPFSSPNTLEGRWACCVQDVMTRKGLCFENACMVNCPLNQVQQDGRTHCCNAYTAQELLDFFLLGYKIDIGPLYQCNNRAPHMDYIPEFIVREDVV